MASDSPTHTVRGTYLGALNVQVFRGDDGELYASHTTDLAPAVHEMQGAMSGHDKTHAVNLRAIACSHVVRFIAYVENPDADISGIEPTLYRMKE